MRAPSARVIDQAGVPDSPTTPNLKMNLALGMMGGLFCSGLFVFIRNAMDARVQGPGSLGVQLNMRELGVIPSTALFSDLRCRPRLLRGVVGKAKRKSSNNDSGISILIPEGQPSEVSERLELVTWSQRTSVISESFRAAMTSILFSNDGQEPQVLVITSPNPQEGKTSVTTNLAIALAEINRRVLLIDADMRLPRLHSIFDLSNTSGLSDFLHERRPVEEYADDELVRKTHIPNLHVMLAGPARSNLSRLFYSSRMKDLLNRFRDSFDTILIDSAPVLSVPDSRIIARSADAVIVVIRAHRTRQEAAFSAVRFFEEDGSRVLGTILNDWNPKRSTYGQYGYGSYGEYGA
jgi:capsular exopolysaccharide synthesis family protein